MEKWKMDYFGPAILNNNLSLAVRRYFQTLCVEGNTEEIVKKKLFQAFKPIMDSNELDVKLEFYIAYTTILWTYGLLDNDILKMTLSLLEESNYIGVWAVRGTKKEIEKREKYLDEWVKKVSSKNLKPKKMPFYKKILDISFAEDGDIFAYQIGDNIKTRFRDSCYTEEELLERNWVGKWIAFQQEERLEQMSLNGTTKRLVPYFVCSSKLFDNKPTVQEFLDSYLLPLGIPSIAFDNRVTKIPEKVTNYNHSYFKEAARTYGIWYRLPLDNQRKLKKVDTIVYIGNGPINKNRSKFENRPTDRPYEVGGFSTGHVFNNDYVETILDKFLRSGLEYWDGYDFASSPLFNDNIEMSVLEAENEMIFQFKEDKTYELSSYTSNKSNVIIPSKYNNIEVTSIGGRAFSGSKDVENVIIPGSIKTIGRMAFMNCKKLKEVQLEKGLTIIGTAAFMDCNNLFKIDIPEGVKIIANTAFANCDSLTEIVIPLSVEKIGEYAFMQISPKLKIYIEASTIPQSWDKLWNVTNCTYELGYKNKILQ
ncbi:MAG: leucine-rich repeat domain-containing protein [Bacilli bacterium]|nr:leucine-rich repeat domain-containing protein [Bacilli bacterium]